MAQPNVKTQPGEKRRNNFNEVSFGYTKKITAEESKRCPQCSDPVCMQGCPLGINIPGFIRQLRENNVAGAYQTIKDKNPLPSICGRICSAPCEAACVLNDESSPIGIRALERFAADYGKSKVTRQQRKGKKIAIIGSGPAGLTAAYELAQKGYQVTIFEALDHPGGVLRYGIPEFRIPKKFLDQEINEIKMLGVEIQTNFYIGQTKTIQELKDEGFCAILLAMGAGIPKFMDLPGHSLGGVYYGEEFLMRVNLTKPGLFSRNTPNFPLGQKVAVIGSGNTALDCARTAVRFGCDVSLIFRRTEEDMRVRREEKEFAKQEGIKLEPLIRPIEIMADQDNFVGGLKCERMDFADDGVSEEWRLLPVPESDFIMEVDTVIIAIGHQPNSLLNKLMPDLILDDDGTIQIDEETYLTSIPDVFAAGNVVTNAGPVVSAIASGKAAAEKIYQALTT